MAEGTLLAATPVMAVYFRRATISAGIRENITRITPPHRRLVHHKPDGDTDGDTDRNTDGDADRNTVSTA